MTRGEFADAVYTYCVMMGASVTSGRRTWARNVDVGGVAHSAHLVGLAVDVEYDSSPVESQRREWAERLGLYLHVEEGRDHLQPLDWRAG